MPINFFVFIGSILLHSVAVSERAFATGSAASFFPSDSLVRYVHGPPGIVQLH